MNLSRNLTIALGAVLAVCALGTISPVMAQNAAAPTQRQLDLAAARAQRKALVGEAMELTPAEAPKFWALYNQYEGEMDKIQDRHLREIKEFAKHYNTLTEQDAASKLNEVIAIQQARLDVEKAYIPKFRAAISQVKVTRFFQIDSKLRAMVQCDIAQMVPLARAGAGNQ
jgi:L-lactate utilization protein LutC